LLARRKAKREKLKKILDNLGEKKVAEDGHYNEKLAEIKQKEIDEKAAGDGEIE